MRNRFIHIIFLSVSLLMVGWGTDVKAQFHEMESLPWVPQRPEEQKQVNNESDQVLEDLAKAMDEGQYKQVVDWYYPLAISNGFQRNANLYNQTRRALRHILQTPEWALYWTKMQNLYHDRYANIGRDEYHYRNTLETTTWCDEQLNNEQILMMMNVDERMEVCFERAHEILSRSGGKADPVIVLQGMFVPLNRVHAAHPERGKEFVYKYNDVLRWLEVTEKYMKQEHAEDYETYYNAQTIALVREESQLQVNADANVAAFESRRVDLQEQIRAQVEEQNSEVRAQRIYAEAIVSYQKKNYAEAYQKVNEVLAIESNMKEAHVLKSNILQNSANASNRMADKVAFWCAAYEAGQGYVDRKVQRHILSALKSHLFMTGLAGQIHSTRSPFSIRQRIWTVEELRDK
jgi:hypothetical protein